MHNIKKKRDIQLKEYELKYGDIPKDYNDRLSYMVDKLNVNEKKMNEIINTKNYLLDNISFNELFIVLYEEPMGAYRPRFRLVGRHNLIDEAMTRPAFVHVYQPRAKEDSMYLKRLIDDELININQLICTPCIVEINSYFRTPSNYNITETFLAEYGLDWCIKKPDWDNIGKKYSDMYNYNVWLDDTLTISGTVNKFYSFLPRVEIRLLFMDKFVNKKQYLSVVNRGSFIQQNLDPNNYGYY